MKGAHCEEGEYLRFILNVSELTAELKVERADVLQGSLNPR
jgi:hypothetical protein